MEINKEATEVQLLRTDGEYAWISIDRGESWRDSLRFRVARVKYDEFPEITH